MANTNWDEFNKKYKKEITGIANTQKVDTNEARDMFISNISRGGQYAGGGVVDTTQAKSDYEQIRANLLDSSRQSDGDYQPYSTFQAPQYTGPTAEEAYAQADTRLSPQIQSIKNTLISKIATTRETLPQQLSARGQALGGQRALAEQDISSQEALQMANIGLQGETAKQELAQDIMTQAEAKYQQSYQNAFNLWRAEVSDATTQQQINYAQKRDALSDMRYEEEKAWSRNEDNPQVQAQILNNKLKMFDLENAPQEQALKIQALQQDLEMGKISLANAKSQANAIDKEVNGLSADELKFERSLADAYKKRGDLDDPLDMDEYITNLQKKGLSDFQITQVLRIEPEVEHITTGDAWTTINEKMETSVEEAKYFLTVNEDIFREDFGQTYDDMWRYVVGEEEEEEPRTFMGLKY